MSNIKVLKILNGKILEYTYLVYNEGQKECICIDPGYEYEPIKKVLDKEGLTVDSILLTHGHFDHMLSCYDLWKRDNSKIYVSKEDEEILYSAEHNYSNLINKTSFDHFDIYKNVKDSEVISILGIEIKCISTPGHTKGGYCYYIDSDKILFSGDTLFYQTFGRTDLYGGSYHEMELSIINKLFDLPNDTKVYPGHGNETLISYEKLHNEIRSQHNE